MKLIDYRKQNALTQQQFADLIGKDDTTVSKYESGDIKPSLDTILIIERVTGRQVTVADFVKA